MKEVIVTMSVTLFILAGIAVLMYFRWRGNRQPPPYPLPPPSAADRRHTELMQRVLRTTEQSITVGKDLQRELQLLRESRVVYLQMSVDIQTRPGQPGHEQRTEPRP
jgi:hypothetical protein